MYFLEFTANDRKYILHDGRQTIIGSDAFNLLEHYVMSHTHIALAVGGFDTINISREKILSMVDGAPVTEFVNERNFIYYGVEIKHTDTPSGETAQANVAT